jgi:hypothetical protein
LRSLVEKCAPDAEIFQAVDALDSVSTGAAKPEVQP